MPGMPDDVSKNMSMHLLMHVFICLYRWPCMSLYTCPHTHLCHVSVAHVHAHVCTHVRIDVCATCLYACPGACLCTWRYPWLDIFTHIFMHWAGRGTSLPCCCYRRVDKNVYTHVHAHVYTHGCAHACAYACTHVCMYVYTHVLHMSIRMSIHMYAAEHAEPVCETSAIGWTGQSPRGTI